MADVEPGRDVAVQQIQRQVSRRMSVAARALVARLIQKSPLRYYVTTAGHPTAALTRLMFPEFDHYWRFAFVRNPYDRFMSAFLYRNMIAPPLSLDTFLDQAYLHLQPQENFIYSRGRCLVDFIGRVEEVDDAFAEICDRLDLPRVQLAVENATDKPADEGDLPVAVRERICQLYRADFERFGYEM